MNWQEADLLSLQQKQQALQNGKTVFDAVCESDVNSGNVDRLVKIMAQFVEKSREFHINTEDQATCDKLNQFTQSVLRYHPRNNQENTAIMKFLASLPTRCLLVEQAQARPLDVIFSARAGAPEQQQVWKKVARIMGERHLRAHHSEEWQTLCGNSDLLLELFSPLERHACIDILTHEQDYAKAEESIFKLLREAASDHFRGQVLQLRPFQFLPTIKQVFPRSPHLILYFHKVDRLAQLVDLPLDASVRDEAFVHNLLEQLGREAFSSSALDRTLKTLGRYIYNESFDAITLVGDFDNTCTQLEQMPDIIENKIKSILRPRASLLHEGQQIFEEAVLQGELIDMLSKTLIVPKVGRGIVNVWLIDDVKKGLAKAQLSTKYPSLAAHLDQVLDELQNNPAISNLLRETKVPPVHSQGEVIVRQACKLARGTLISQVHVMRAILSARVSDWRQVYFGSCHTTAPILAMENSVGPLLIRDWQEILETGFLTRKVQGQTLAFAAGANLSPVFQDLVVPNKAFGPHVTAQQRNAFFEELARMPLIQKMVELFGIHKAVAPTIMEAVLQLTPVQNFTCKQLFDALKPVDIIDRNVINTIQDDLNSLYQNPLLQCWQNSLMGMHCPPLHIPSYSTEDFSSALRTAFSALAQAKGIIPNPFAQNNAFEQPQCRAIQTLCFRVTPPRDAHSQDAIVEVYKSDPAHPFAPKLITREFQFKAFLADLFTQITGRPLEFGEDDALLNNMTASFREKTHSMNAPWNFPVGVVSAKSAFWNIYFQTENVYDDLNFQADLPQAICTVRDWLGAQKARYGNIEGLKMPAHIPQHCLTALLSEQMLENPGLNSANWMRQVEGDLNALSFDDPEMIVPFVALKETLRDRLVRRQAAATYARIEAIQEKNFVTWCKQCHQILDQADIHFLEGDTDFLLFSWMAQLSPAFAGNFLYKFADTNWITAAVHGLVGQAAATYYAFALVPQVGKPLKWGVVELSAGLVKPVKIEDVAFFGVLRNPGRYFESAIAQNALVGAKKVDGCIADHVDFFIRNWNKLKEDKPEERLNCVNNLRAEWNSFRAEMKRLRDRYNFDVNAKLFATISLQPEQEEPLRALFASDEQEWSVHLTQHQMNIVRARQAAQPQVAPRAGKRALEPEEVKQEVPKLPSLAKKPLPPAPQKPLRATRNIPLPRVVPPPHVVKAEPKVVKAEPKPRKRRKKDY